MKYTYLPNTRNYKELNKIYKTMSDMTKRKQKINRTGTFE